MQNLEQYKDELKLLLSKGSKLGIIIEYNYRGKAIEAELKNILGDDFKRKISELPDLKHEYESWYSEAKSLVRQLLPDRLDDFIAHYEKPKDRKALTAESYRISDLLTGLSVTAGEYPKKVIVDECAAIPHFYQQLAIVKAVKRRFESSLFDIKPIVQADVLDSELDAAKLLVEHGFLRAGGAIAGVVMEKHLSQVCENHGIKLRKKKPVIADYNDRLKTEKVIDIPQWRFNQRLGDLRNLCVHNKDVDPTDEQVTDLIDGVMKLTKTLY